MRKVMPNVFIIATKYIEKLQKNISQREWINYSNTVVAIILALDRLRHREQGEKIPTNRPDMKTLAISIAAVILTACGGGSNSSGSSDEPEPSAFAELRIELDGVPLETISIEDLQTIDDARLLIASTPIDFYLDIFPAWKNKYPSFNEEPGVSCQIGGIEMTKEDPGIFSLRLFAAYEQEQFELACSLQGADMFSTTFTVKAYDPELDTYIENYAATSIPVASDYDPDDPYSGYRRNNYYSEIYRFLSVAEMYTTPEFYGIDPEGTNFSKLELYLINTAEAFFEPCPNYDFLGPRSRQCRSIERDGAYYLWRSANIKDAVRTIHPKVEWRAAGGIAQAIKALLIRNPIMPDISCPASDKPSTIRDDASLACRALNVRRLLFEEIWLKWNDDAWADSKGVSRLQRIPDTITAHYISWFELIVDLFNSTQNISVSFECADCSSPIVAESRIDDLISLFFDYSENQISFTCKPPDDGSCIWNGYDLEIPGSAEIGHVDTMIHLLTLNDQREVCDSGLSTCINLAQLADSMYELTWVDWVDNVDGAEGFPKFDVFFNGHCSRAYNDSDDPMNFFCIRYWLTEIGGWEPHRKLLGWVNLGRFNRDLMIALRRAADENHDGILIDEDDARLSTFAVFLRKAQRNQAN